MKYHNWDVLAPIEQFNVEIYPNRDYWPLSRHPTSLEVVIRENPAPMCPTVDYYACYAGISGELKIHKHFLLKVSFDPLVTDKAIRQIIQQYTRIKIL